MVGRLAVLLLLSLSAPLYAATCQSTTPTCVPGTDICIMNKTAGNGCCLNPATEACCDGTPTSVICNRASQDCSRTADGSAAKCCERQYENVCGGGKCCNKNWETCCGNFCCNDALERCQEYTDVFGVKQKGCTRLEWMSTIQGFMVIGIPIMCGVLFVILFLASFFVLKGGIDRGMNLMQWGIVFLGYIMMAVGMMICFSPEWYHGMLTIVLGFVSVAIGTTRSVIALLIAWSMQYLMIIVHLNPYFPNVLLTFGEEGGLLRKLWWYLWSVRTVNDNATNNFAWSHLWDDPPIDPPADGRRFWCPDYYYGYFRFDAKVRDLRKHNPAELHYGYCGGEWLTILFMAVCINILVNLLLEFLTIGHMVLVIIDNKRRKQMLGQTTSIIPESIRQKVHTATAPPIVIPPSPPLSPVAPMPTPNLPVHFSSVPVIPPPSPGGPPSVVLPPPANVYLPQWDFH